MNESGIGDIQITLLRYRGQGKAAGDTAATLFLLLDLATFFDLFHGGKLKEALDTLTKLKLVPLSSSEVDQRVSAFRLLGEDVRRNLPDILVAAMTALHSQYQGMKAKGQVRKWSLKYNQNNQKITFYALFWKQIAYLSISMYCMLLGLVFAN